MLRFSLTGKHLLASIRRVLVSLVQFQAIAAFSTHLSGVVRHTVRFWMVGRANRKKLMEKKKVTYYLKETAQWAVLIVFVITFLTIPIIQCENKEINARLDKLEAASTTAQQPQERNSFDSLLIRANSMWIRDSIIHEKEIEFWKHHKIVICK